MDGVDKQLQGSLVWLASQSRFRQTTIGRFAMVPRYRDLDVPFTSKLMGVACLVVGSIGVHVHSSMPCFGCIAWLAVERSLVKTAHDVPTSPHAFYGVSLIR